MSYRPAPPDPLSPVHAFAPVWSAAPVTSLPRELPCVWIGNGLEAAGIEPMSETSADHLEQLLAEHGGYEVIMLEPEKVTRHTCQMGVVRGLIQTSDDIPRAAPSGPLWPVLRASHARSPEASERACQR